MRWFDSLDTDRWWLSVLEMGGIERSDEDGMVISSLSSIPISLEIFSTTGEAFGARGTEGESARVGVCCADCSGDDVNAGAS